MIFKEEIAHIVFDNVQSKVLFLRIMTGWEQPDFGKFYYNEEAIPFSGLREKIALITNESQLVNYLSIAENIFLMREKVRAWKVDFPMIEKKTEQLFEELGIQLSIHRNVSSLTDYEKNGDRTEQSIFFEKADYFYYRFWKPSESAGNHKTEGNRSETEGKGNCSGVCGTS